MIVVDENGNITNVMPPINSKSGGSIGGPILDKIKGSDTIPDVGSHIGAAASGLFGDIMIQVDPEQLFAASEEVLSTVRNLRGRFDSLNSRVKGMKNYWEGSVSNIRQKRHTRSQTQMDEMLNTLTQYAQELKQIAANYTDTESANTEASASLQSGILS